MYLGNKATAYTQLFSQNTVYYFGHELCLKLLTMFLYVGVCPMSGLSNHGTWDEEWIQLLQMTSMQLFASALPHHE